MYYYLIIILFISKLLPIDISLFNNTIDWIELQNNKIKISYKEKDNFKYCKASTVYNSNPEKIKNILDDKDNYTNIFKRMEFCNSLTDKIVHIRLDLPFPFYGRDYIVEYDYFKMKDFEYYIYNSTDKINITTNKNYVRLPNASGIWVIEPITNESTKLTFIWNGELLGNFPDWALNIAWTKQGNEVLTWIKKALDN